MNAAFFAIHEGLPREGPGDRESLDRALGLAGTPRDGRICDAGCGPGADVPALLAHVPAGHVHAVDLHAPFIARVRAAHAGDARVTAEVADMARLTGPYDLIWSAGAAYHLGVAEALAGWRGALAPGGRIAFSELCWAGAARPEAAARFFAEEYPPMTDVDGVLGQIAAAGFRCLGQRFLSRAGWAAYYGPLEARLDALAGRAEGDAELAAAVAMHRDEVAVWRAHGDSFGYLVCVAAP